MFFNSRLVKLSSPLQHDLLLSSRSPNAIFSFHQTPLAKEMQIKTKYPSINTVPFVQVYRGWWPLHPHKVIISSPSTKILSETYNKMGASPSPRENHRETFDSNIQKTALDSQLIRHQANCAPRPYAPGFIPSNLTPIWGGLHKVCWEFKDFMSLLSLTGGWCQRIPHGTTGAQHIPKL